MNTFNPPLPRGRSRANMSSDGAAEMTPHNSGGRGLTVQSLMERCQHLRTSIVQQVVARDPACGAAFKAFAFDGYPEWKLFRWAIVS